MKRGKIVTFSIVLLNILAVIANLVIGGGSFFGLLLSGGGYVKEYGEASFDLVIRQGQWWRLLTCGYLHMGIIHLAGNMVALKIVGDKVEEKIGPVKMLLFYNLGMMLTASLWSLIFKNGSMVGASLGIFVLLGMVCVGCRKGQEKQRVCFSVAEQRYLIIYIIVGCFLGIGTIVVHVIGFVVGVLVGIVMLKIGMRGKGE